MDRLRQRPRDLDGYAETELKRTTQKQKRKERIAFYGSLLAGFAIVAWVLLYSNPKLADVPWWWWPLLLIGWLLLSALLSALIGMVLFHGAIWRCGDCGSKLEERHTTDTSDKGIEYNATIFACHRCRKFQAYLSTQGSSD